MRDELVVKYRVLQYKKRNDTDGMDWLVIGYLMKYQLQLLFSNDGREWSHSIDMKGMGRK